MQAITIGLDIAKNLLQVHGVADHGWVLRKRLGRAQVLTFVTCVPAVVMLIPNALMR